LSSAWTAFRQAFTLSGEPCKQNGQLSGRYSHFVDSFIIIMDSFQTIFVDSHVKLSGRLSLIIDNLSISMYRFQEDSGSFQADLLFSIDSLVTRMDSFLADDHSKVDNHAIHVHTVYISSGTIFSYVKYSDATAH
jgi:hypothetical protein